MRVIGWCELCKKFKSVRVLRWFGQAAIGVCDDCDD